MTSKEAIEIINDVTWDDNGRHYGKIKEARDMAISALEQQIEIVQCKDCEYWDDGVCWMNSEEPDQISRGHYSHTEQIDFCSCGVRKEANA